MENAGWEGSRVGSSLPSQKTYLLKNSISPSREEVLDKSLPIEPSSCLKRRKVLVQRNGKLSSKYNLQVWQPFSVFLIALLTCPNPSFSQTLKDPDPLLTAILAKLKVHYFRPLSSEELKATSTEELLSSLDAETHLETVVPSSSDFVRGLERENSIPETYPLNESWGYIRILFWGRRASADFHKVLESFTQKGIQGLILDLRGNSGGSLESGISVLEHLLPAGALLFMVKDKNGKGSNRYCEKGNKPFFRIIVLIDGKTASTSEMVADALRRNIHAMLVGEPTYGKRSIQEAFLMDASHIFYVTTGFFELPGDVGRNKKIEPDLFALSEQALDEAQSLLKKRILGNS